MSIEVQTAMTELFPPNIGTYTDFREFLRDWYEYRRRTMSSPVRPYNYSTFSAAADIKSPNYLKLIIEGQRNLSEDMAHKFAKALQLSREHAEEFLALVRYGQASDPTVRNQFLRELSEMRVQKKIRSGEINAEAYEKVPSWINWVLYYLADQENVEYDAKRLKDILKGKATPEAIQRALNTLFSSGELVRDDEGNVKKGRELINNADDVPVALVRKLQAELIYLGLESLFEEDAQERDFGAFTMALTKKEFEHLKFELRKIRKKLFTDFMVERTKSKGERVYQLNIQLFPVTKPTPSN